MKTLPSIEGMNIAGKRVLIRADLNVPMKGNKITDATRIERFAPTVRKLLDRGAAVIVITHLGRPEGEINPVFSTKPVAEALSGFLGKDVKFIPDCVGPTAEAATGRMNPGDVALLENLRFHKGEMADNASFALRLSVLGDIYVNDAFSCAHRAHASTHAISSLMPHAAGPSLMAEVKALQAALANPVRPSAALVGGAKVSTKIDVLKNLVGTVDYLIIGGGMANTFLAANDVDVGRSLYELGAVGIAEAIMTKAGKVGCRIILPKDAIVADAFSAGANIRTVPINAIGSLEMVLDAGPQSVAEIHAVLEQCRTLLWNGPLGAFEMAPFAGATKAVAEKAAALTVEGRLVTVAGGGDTVAALNGAGVTNDFTYVSTAGGAFLEWLEGRPLPGIEILRKTHRQTEEA